MNLRIIMIALTTGSLGCSAGVGTRATNTPGGFEGSPLKKIGFTGSVVRPERRFAGFVPSAGRVSLIDPMAEAEVWSTEVVGDFVRVVPLPGYDGAALFTSRGLRVLAAGADRTFPDVEFDVGHLAIAADAAAYAAVSADGRHVRVVRFLSGLDWQDETWDLPWATDGEVELPLENGAPLAVAVFKDDGRELLVLRPDDGRYVVYRAAEGAALLGPMADCPGDGTVGDTFRSAVWGSGSDTHVYLGDANGRLLALQPAVDTIRCSAFATLPSKVLGTGLPITQINVLSDGNIGVTQAGGKVHLVPFEGGLFGDPTSHATHCDFPLGVASLGKGSLLLGCFYRVTEDTDGEDDDDEPYPASVPYSKSSLLVVERAGGALKLELPTTDIAAAGAAGALDVDELRLLELKDSALGILEVTSLVDGSSRVRKGLFLKDVLK